MTDKPKRKRWHRYDLEGNKIIKLFPMGKQPRPLKQEGYTEWKIGAGPFAPEALNNIKQALSKACKGIPKTPEHKEKMRLAKLGVPKSLEHRKNMSLAHKGRKYRLKEKEPQ